MKSKRSFLLVLGALTFIHCSSKAKEDPQPTALAIPVNTASATIDGKLFVPDITASTVTLNTRSNELIVTLNASDGSRILVRLVEFKRAAGRFVITDASSSSGPYYTEVANSRVSYFDPRVCTTNNRTVEITAFNGSERTVSGTFTGTVCSSNTSRTVQVTSGRFNLPFVEVQ